MKLFHISDVLTITTSRLVSRSRMGGVYGIYNYLTGDSLYTHQLVRAAKECAPWVRAQFPQLFPENDPMKMLLDELDEYPQPLTEKTVADWVSKVQQSYGLPEMLPVYEMGEDMHTHIDPVEELTAMVGDGGTIIVIDSEKENL